MYTYSARVNKEFSRLTRYEVGSTCTSKYQLVTLGASTGTIFMLIAPGASRLLQHAGLVHLGLWDMQITSVGSGGAGYDTPCPTLSYPIKYLFRSDGKVKIDPCG